MEAPVNVAVPVLEARQLSKHFGALAVTNNVNFSLALGARHALIGPNGAGKTTFINLLSGTLRPSAGSVFLAGEDVTRCSEAQRVKRGLGRTFQINQLYVGLTVLENVLIAVAERAGIAYRLFRPIWWYRKHVDEAYAHLEQLGIAEDALKPVRELSYGRQRLVEIALALALRPAVLLLDEPAAGVPKGESSIILDVIGALPRDVAVLIIEHDMDIVFRFAQRVTVMVQGVVFAEGIPREISADPRVRSVYLGEQPHG
jgi:ABC-type branched-subunit amino acid transport system ATPase component